MVDIWNKTSGGGAGGGGGSSWNTDTIEPTKTYTTEPEPLSDASKQNIQAYNDSLIQTTTAQRNTTADRMQDFATVTGEQPTDKKSEYQAELDRIKAEAEKAQAGIDKLKEQEKAGTTTPTEESGISASIQASIDRIEQQALDDAESANNAYDKLQAQLDASYRQMVAATKQVYSDRIREMKAANQRLLQTKETVGIRTGRQRYTPVMQDGLLTQEEIEGVKRVTTLANQLTAALAQAADAKAQNDLKNFNAAYDRIDAIKKQAKDTVTKLYDAANKEYENMLEAKKQQRIADKENLDLAIKKADQTAPAIAARISELSTPEQQAEFIDKMAANLGIDANVLLGSVYDSMQDAEKAALDIKNIESQIGVRWSSENRQQDKYNQEQQDRQDKDTLRMNIVEKLDSGAINVDQARTAWGMVFPLDEFEKEFTGYIEEI